MVWYGRIVRRPGYTSAVGLTPQAEFRRWQEIPLQLSRYRLFHSEMMEQNDISDYVPLY
jgi:hypothetical protein